ncbi:MAG: acetyl-CoA carboxylase, carboxyltransferase subunit beta [Alphaproteobacteria bacterium]
MNWLSDHVRPRIQRLVGEKKETPDNLWTKCQSCDQMLFQKALEENLYVCTNCGHHHRMGVVDRLKSLFDDGNYDRLDMPELAADPLKFKDKKPYPARMREYQTKTGEKDAIIVATGEMGARPVVIAAFNFAFMGGSMGRAVGEGLVMAAEEAVKKKASLLVIPASGGARMQEGILSLMQMPRSIIAVERMREARLPYVVLLTNPTTGGVTASFAMLGDITIAEPDAVIGFAGRRVIEETIREQLPDDFQTAEYLQEHGMVDQVVDRLEMRGRLITIFELLRGVPGPSVPTPHEETVPPMKEDEPIASVDQE